MLSIPGMSPMFLLVSHHDPYGFSKLSLTRTDLPKEIENAPCHVQLIGRRLKDEKLVRHAEVVQSVLAKGSH